MEKDSKLPQHLALVYENITYYSLEEAEDSINAEKLDSTSILEIGEDLPIFYDGEVILYKINDKMYPGMIIDILLENNKELAYLVVKRMGVAQLYDIITLSFDTDGGVEVVIDAYSGGIHQSLSNNMDMAKIFSIVSCGTVDLEQYIVRSVQEAIDYHTDMMDALDEFTDPEKTVTIH